MTDDAPAPTPRRTRLLLLLLAGAVVAVVAIALIAVWVQRAPAQLDEATPEGVVQRYVQAVLGGDADTALSYVVSEVAADCERIPLDTQDRRVTLVETTQRADTATVAVLIVTVYGSGPLGSDQYESEGTFDLVRADDTWAIRTAPWEFAVCTETGRG